MIITYKNKDVFVGNLVVKDAVLLKEFRDELLMTKNKGLGIRCVSQQKDLGGLCSVLNEGFIRKNDTLIHQQITSCDGEDCLYTKREYECQCLSSILLLTSLLGDLNVQDYNGIAKEFVRLGIVHYGSFEKFWKEYFGRIVNRVYSEIDAKNVSDLRKLKMLDLNVIRFALKEGMIFYDIKDMVSLCGSVHQYVAGTRDDLQQFNINNALLLEDNSLFEKYMKIKGKK